MKIKIYPIFLIIIFLIIFFVFYKGLKNSNIYTPEVNIKENIPSFKAKFLNSTQEIKSEDIFINNNFYLINIWASWCVPCKEEHPFLMELSRDKNIEIIGLNYKDNNKNANFFLNKFNNPYKFSILDSDGTIAIEWGAYGVPETFLIQKKKIIKKIIGPIDKVSFLEIKEMIQ